ncbi:Stress responsive alpha-beta barrel domain protein [Fibrella aestuarina BUZ 2]|uniref:Stress responsive alpha-beta barrel domain protein n=2 Tax=Fibrella TaxID=861914 RepID=I0K615_9BACT|nr:Stress responsive alpha-beta barrel domain protein [Fibrella aestuarina BUZ 2]
MFTKPVSSPCDDFFYQYVSFMNQILCSLCAVLLFATTALADPPKKQAPKAMLQHIVLFKFKPETTPEKVTEIIAAFEALPSKIKEIKSFQWGTNNSPEKLDKGLTHAFILTFDSAKDRDTYLPHPAHKQFGSVVGPWLADVTVVDFVNQAK